MAETAVEHTTRAGRLLCIDQGTYSDYGVVGFFVVLKDFVPMAELRTYLEINPEQKEDYHLELSRFLAYLIAQGALLEIDYDRLFMGSYDCAESVSFTPFSR